MVKRVRNWEQDYKSKNTDPMECPNRIRLLRFEKGWSSGELGKRMGTGSAIILDYERGRFNPGWNVINRLCKIFGVETGDLFWRKGERKIEKKAK